MHSALTMSEPRRKPESTRIGIRPFTASTISGSASMVERPESSERAPWFDTMMPSRPASAAITASSQARMPLSQQLHLGCVAHPLDEIPVHVRRLGVAQPREVEALEHGPALQSRLQVRPVVAAVAVAGVARPQPEQGFLIAAAAAVDRDGDGGAAGVLGALDDGFRDALAVGGIKLQPDRRAARLGHLLDPVRGHGGHDLQVVAGFGGRAPRQARHRRGTSAGRRPAPARSANRIWCRGCRRSCRPC